jgi:hypothetical protein
VHSEKEVHMRRNVIIGVALIALAVCLGLAGAQEEKSEGMLGRVKGVISGSEEKTPTPKTCSGGAMEKVKSALPGSEEKAAAPKEGAGILEKVKDVIPGESGK